jgi:hypothetical protein
MLKISDFVGIIGVFIRGDALKLHLIQLGDKNANIAWIFSTTELHRVFSQR